MRQLRQRLLVCLQLFRAHYWSRAVELFQTVEPALNGMKTMLQEGILQLEEDDEQHFADCMDWLEGRELLAVQRMQSELPEKIDQIGSTDGWQATYDSDGIRAFYKADPSSPNQTFKVTGNVDAPVFNCLAMFYEFDFYPKWMPGIGQANVLSAPSRFSIVGQASYSVPWPMYSREARLYAYGDVVQHGRACAIYARDATDMDPTPYDGLNSLQQLAEAEGQAGGRNARMPQRHGGGGSALAIPALSRHVLMKFNYGCFLLTPLTDKITKVRMHSVSGSF